MLSIKRNMFHGDFAVSNPVVIGESTSFASPAVHPDRSLLPVNLTKIPIMSYEKLHTLLSDNFTRYGLVREIVIYLDDWSGRWYTGNGHVYLERPASSEAQYETLTYKIPLAGDKPFSCLGTWTNKGKHCFYCKNSGHYRKECPEAPKENRRCYQCGNTGHIARNCYRTKTDESTSNKRRRGYNAPASRSHNLSTFEDFIVSEDAPSVEIPSPTELAKTSNGETYSEVVSVISSLSVIDLDDSMSADTIPRSRPSRYTAGRNPQHSDFVSTSPAKPCRCGSLSHKTANSKLCPLNKKFGNLSPDGSTPTNAADNSFAPLYNGDLLSSLGEIDEVNAMEED
ncbi:hypothetical protein INT47_012174 [Mucor saturninus]|uniref:CCHC-type domain-containing protein n=1 Tax=Mucor saturninus TaxID=64648 RepID=A0A8H7QVJ8_9FUNG|nr:hypothetical protein INT47_012174 [Mucor saturninus]